MAISSSNKPADNDIVTPPTSTESEFSLNPEDPRPHYYICRNDKTLVPLIAVDELPPIIRLHRVPTSLTSAEIEEWDMARCGDIIDRAKNLYRIEFNINSNSYGQPNVSKPSTSPRSGNQKSSTDSAQNHSQESKDPTGKSKLHSDDHSEPTPEVPETEHSLNDQEQSNSPAGAGEAQVRFGDSSRNID